MRPNWMLKEKLGIPGALVPSYLSAHPEAVQLRVVHQRNRKVGNLPRNAANPSSRSGKRQSMQVDGRVSYIISETKATNRGG